MTPTKTVKTDATTIEKLDIIDMTLLTYLLTYD